MACPSERRSENPIGYKVTSPRPPVNWRGNYLKLEMPVDCRRWPGALRLPHVGGTKLRRNRAVDCRSSFDIGLFGARNDRAAAVAGGAAPLPAARPAATFDAGATPA